MPNLILNRLFPVFREKHLHVVSPFLCMFVLVGQLKRGPFAAYSRFNPRQLLLQFRALVKAHRCRDALNSAEQVDRKATPETS